MLSVSLGASRPPPTLTLPLKGGGNDFRGLARFLASPLEGEVGAKRREGGVRVADQRRRLCANIAAQNIENNKFLSEAIDLCGRQIFALLTLMILTLATAAPAAAHRPSDAYLSLSVGETSIEGQWDIALRDLEHAIGLDRDRDAAITWGELKAQHAAIAAYALARLSLETAAGGCPARAHDHLVDRHDDEAFSVIRFVAECPGPVTTLDVGYDLLFDLDALHRGLVQVERGGEIQSVVFSPDRRQWSLGPGGPDVWPQFHSYLAEGVWHIWIGFDHILFLLVLLLPAVLRFEAGTWRRATSLRESFVDVVKVVTAFTLAHSLTLALATLGWLDLPSRIVEPVIAATIVVSALNNIWPIVRRRLWAVAFGFGLIHGVGFAGALEALGLPSEALLLSLFAFNLGVETGQLAIVAAFLPAAFLLSRCALYPRAVLQLGSVLIAAVATLWLIERSLGVALTT